MMIMVKKVDHIGIFVKDLEASLKKYTSYLGLKVEVIEEVPLEDVTNRLAFMPLGGLNIELVGTTSKKGMVAEFLEESGEAIHHIAFQVDDLEKMFHELRAKGVKFLWDRIIDGSRGTKVAFFKPEEFYGVYIELVQKH